MKKFTINLKNYTCSAICILVQSGYTKKNDIEYILKDENGRFHAKIIGNKIVIHYDLIVGYMHKVFSTPITLRTEQQRILNEIKQFKRVPFKKNNTKGFVEYRKQMKREIKQFKKKGIVSPVSPFKKILL
jgi:hypothetical protein